LPQIPGRINPDEQAVVRADVPPPDSGTSSLPHFGQFSGGGLFGPDDIEKNI
jgi:hypothetical protein